MPPNPTQRILHLLLAVILLLTGTLGCENGGTKWPGAPSAPLPTTQPATPQLPPTATAPPPLTPTRARRITFEAGQLVDVRPGIFFVDIATGAIEGWQLPFNPYDANRVAAAQISPDGRFILYPAAGDAAEWRDWTLVDTQSGKTCVLPDVLGWAGAFSPDGLTFLANTAQGIARFGGGCGSSPQPLSLPTDEQLGYASWSPDGRALLVVTEHPAPNPELGSLVTSYLINPPLKKVVTVDQGQGRLIPTTWSPDGAHAVVVSPSWGKVKVVDQAGGVVWTTSLAASSLWNRGWSPDGRSIVLEVDVYTSEKDRSSYVYILDAGTGETSFRVLAASAACGQFWTPDSQSFLVWSYGPNEPPARAPYLLVAADGSAVRHLEDDPAGYAAYLDGLSPSDPGRAVVHTREAASGLESLQVVDLKTGLKTSLVSTPAERLAWDWRHPSRRWLSDGRLVFAAPHAGHGGCMSDIQAPEFRVEFPPFPEVQPVRPAGGK